MLGFNSVKLNASVVRQIMKICSRRVVGPKAFPSSGDRLSRIKYALLDTDTVKSVFSLEVPRVEDSFENQAAGI